MLLRILLLHLPFFFALLRTFPYDNNDNRLCEEEMKEQTKMSRYIKWMVINQLLW